MSSMECSIQIVNGYVQFKVSGEIDMDSLLIRFETAMIVCSAREEPKLLIDLWGIEGGLAETYKVLGGITGVESYSTHFEPFNKSLTIAVLGLKSNADKGKPVSTPGTDVMRKAGIRILHTYDRDEAESWLS